MEEKEFKELLDRYRAGNTSPEENALLEAWYMQLNSGNEAVLNEAALTTATSSISKKMKDQQFPGFAPRFKVHRWLATAAAVATITLGVWFYNNSHILRPAADQNSGKSQYASDVAPGKNTATLTLADGTVINLSDAKTGVVIDASKITYSDNTVISNADPSSRTERSALSSGGKDPSAVGMTSVSTPRGGTYQVILPDGTQVWLNSASSITFPTKFSGKERLVKLTGEAYFEVAKDKAHQFIVASGAQELAVLGTHFNVSSYEDEKATKTTLLEGSISVRHAEFISASRNRKANMQGVNSRVGVLKQVQDDDRFKQDDDRFKQDGEAIILKPGQQSILTNGKQTASEQIKVIEVDAVEATAWKNGYFSFTDENIQDIMQVIARWYDIEVRYEGNITKDGFNGKISRFKNISQVLKMLEDTKLVHFEVKGRRVTVKE